MPQSSTLADTIDALLPQTQCTKCGYRGCRPYAEAIARGAAGINQCPPGGAAGIAELAKLLNRSLLPLNPANGVEQPLRIALIDEAWCIGCTLCIQACPVDAILGAAKVMHTVMPQLCTGCELCVPPCPMDCIAMLPAEPPRAWTPADAEAARSRFYARNDRLARETAENDQRLADNAIASLPVLAARDEPTPQQISQKQAIVAAALERARAARAARASEVRNEGARPVTVSRLQALAAPAVQSSALQKPASAPSGSPSRIQGGDDR